MSDQVAYLDDLLLEDCLDEVFHGGPSADLADRILMAASPVREAATVQDPTPALHAVEGPAPSSHKGRALHTVPQDPEAAFSLPRWAIWLAQGAVAAGLVVLLAVLMFPRDPQAPAGVIAADNSEFEFDPGVEWPEVQAQAGWYVLSDGAPPLTAAESRVEDVKGVVIVKVGDIPNPDELAAQQPWLAQHQVEAQMNGNWIKAGALALCIVSGSAFVDGQYLSAQEVRKGEARKERAEGEVKKDEVNREEKAKSELEKLREEVADLEARLAEARELENEKERKARVERIENALKDKRERIAAIEDKLAGENDKKRDDDAAKKRRDAERRKNADKDEDAAAKERREAEKRRKEAENDDAAEKERREAERRKNAEEDAAARKKREEDARKKREDGRREGKDKREQ